MFYRTSFNRLFIIITTCSLLCCNESNKDPGSTAQTYSIFLPDSSLHLINGIYYYKTHQPFNGELKELWPGGSTRSIKRLANGNEEGLSETFYSNSCPESRRWYRKGEKDSVHTGWWENGNKKYEYHFRNGLYNGWFTEWYKNGNMILQVMYSNGRELYGKGWRDNGKLYMNFVMKNGRRYGMNNSNLCYNTSNDSIIRK